MSEGQAYKGEYKMKILILVMVVGLTMVVIGIGPEIVAEIKSAWRCERGDFLASIGISVFAIGFFLALFLQASGRI